MTTKKLRCWYCKKGFKTLIKLGTIDNPCRLCRNCFEMWDAINSALGIPIHTGQGWITK